MKKFVFFLSLMLLSGCVTTQSAIKKDTEFSKFKRIYMVDMDYDPRGVEPKIRERFEAMGMPVALIEESDSMFGSQGTGFIVSSEGYVLTSSHVIGDAREATVWLNGKRYEAALVYNSVDPADIAFPKKSDAKQSELERELNSKANRSIDDNLKFKDVAFLKIRSSGEAFKPLSFAVKPDYAIGSDIYTMGFPLSNILGNKPRLTKGLISSSVGIKDNPNFVQISAEIQPGNSGGPLLDAKAQLIGMVQMSLDPGVVYSQTDTLPQNVNFALKSDGIREFLVEGKEKTSIVLSEAQETSFDSVQDSIVKVHAGNVSDEALNDNKLICTIEYASIWDMWYRFQYFEIVLQNPDSGEILLKAGQYGDNPFTSEDGTLDQVFEQIKAKMGR